ncbi:hypothetical protein AHMF7616_04412 [Adhaeribacter pallidiroseus]|uniref:Uncharacterized protein n=1 Tax=Adhaeribacter pallidiroseus TaxID=2072847 RepID=A0A369QN73_9BACT|nr:hypothetical protein AHMF7616_04412 [Adhaeribacter pallidiroseus]
MYRIPTFERKLNKENYLDIGQLIEQCRQGNAKAQEWVY